MTTQIIREKSTNICNKWGLEYPGRMTTLGRLGELVAYDFFRSKGFKTEISCGYEYDLLVEHLSVEVKSAIKINGKYKFNLKHNRTKGVNNFDLLLLLLFESPAKTPVFITIPEFIIGDRDHLWGADIDLIEHDTPLRDIFYN